MIQVDHGIPEVSKGEEVVKQKLDTKFEIFVRCPVKTTVLFE